MSRPRPTEKIRAMRRAFSCAVCQARHRRQEWNITWEQWVQLWSPNDLYLRRGRGRDAVCFTRLDLEDSWHINNVTIESKHDYLLRICDQRTEMRRTTRMLDEYSL